MRTAILSVCFLLAFAFDARAEDLRPLTPADLYQFAGPQTVVLAPQADRAAIIWRSVDRDSRDECFSLWLADGAGSAARPLEMGEPDARAVAFSPDGKWLAIRSTRPLPRDTPPIPATPPQSDAATDIWLLNLDDQRAIPLAGADKAYGRVFTDPFYGRVAFSPDGKRLAFVADDGRDQRTPAEHDANVFVVRPDQGEGYTGFRPAQIWVADLAADPQTVAATRIRRLTHDDVWYGDPQWTPDGTTLICHANQSSDVESVRFSINKNYDLWAIDADSGAQRRLTFGPGPEVSPRIAPSGKQVVCLSSPRKGPHADVYNLLLVALDGAAAARSGAQVLYNHHGESPEPAPHPIPLFPLPEECWDGEQALVYTTAAGALTQTVRLDLATKRAAEVAIDPAADLAALTPLVRRMSLQRKLSPPGNVLLDQRLKAEDRLVHWENEGLALEGVLTLPPPQVAQPPYPLIAYPHGGPHSRSVKGFHQTAHMFAHAGYAVFQPNFRGSPGYGVKFLDADRLDFGGGDLRDVLTGIDKLIEQQLVDPRRQFVYGTSYGGYLTTRLIGQTTQFRAAVAQNAVTDLNVMWGLSDLQSWTFHELGGQPWEVAAKMRQQSPIEYVAQIRTPTLILHAREDRRVPIAMGRMFHQSLRTRGVPTAMVEYPDEGHGIKQPKHQVDFLQRTLDWFAAHDVNAPVEIVTLGDSITKGVRTGVAADDTFAARLQAALGENNIAARVTNVGIGGERTDQALQRLQPDVMGKSPKFVTIMYGTNDSYVDKGKTEPRLSVDQYRDNLVQLVERLRRAGITPILMTEPRWGAKAGPNGIGEHPNKRLEKYVVACREVAAEFKTPLVDHFADWTAAEATGQNLGDWTTDQCHPNPAGHQRMAALMLPVLLSEAEKHRPPRD